MKSRPSPRSTSLRFRVANASAKASGLLARMSRSRAKSKALRAGPISNSLEDSVDLSGRGHGSGTFAPRCDERAGDIGEAKNAGEIPAFDQPVAERAAERVTGTETVDHIDEIRGNLDGLIGGLRQHTLRALLDDR